MRVKPGIFLGILTCLLARAVPALAQRDTFRLDPARFPNASEALRRRLEAERSVRVRNRWGSVELYGMRLVPAGFSYDSALGAPLASLLAFDEAYAIQRRGRNTLRGAVIGSLGLGLPAAALGVLIGGWACFSSDEPGDPPCSTTGTQVGLGVGLGFLGSLVGGVVGGLIGSGSTSWKTVLRSPP